MAEVFDITHDAGNLDEYTSTVTDEGDLSVEVTAALAGSAYGLQCLIDGTGAIYGRKDFTELTSTAYRFRIYVDPNELGMGTDDNFIICHVLNGTSSRAKILLSYDGDNYEIIGEVRNDGYGNDTTAKYDITDAEHYIEVLIEYASGEAANDGVITLWVDGVLKESVDTIDLYNLSKPDSARLGAVGFIDETTTGTFYLDEFVLRDDDTEIGAVEAAGQPMSLRGITVPHLRQWQPRVHS